MGWNPLRIARYEDNASVRHLFDLALVLTGQLCMDVSRDV